MQRSRPLGRVSHVCPDNGWATVSRLGSLTKLTWSAGLDILRNVPQFSSLYLYLWVWDFEFFSRNTTGPPFLNLGSTTYPGTSYLNYLRVSLLICLFPAWIQGFYSITIDNFSTRSRIHQVSSLQHCPVAYLCIWLTSWKYPTYLFVKDLIIF